MSEQVPEIHHGRNEIANNYSCQKLIKTWTDSGTPSAQVIPALHTELMKGVAEYQMKGLVPLRPGDYRITDVDAHGEDNLYVPGLDVSRTMSHYTRDLDDRLMDDIDVAPELKLQKTVHDAAWGYYVYERIHPHLDGNGRMGRMILKRITKGRGYKDIIFQTNAAYGKGREEHLRAMSAVGNSGNLAHLELYLLRQLQYRYLDSPLNKQIEGLMVQKREEISSQTQRKDLTEIWKGFEGLNIDGVQPPPQAMY